MEKNLNVAPTEQELINAGFDKVMDNEVIKLIEIYKQRQKKALDYSVKNTYQVVIKDLENILNKKLYKPAIKVK